jgi:S1-C subfamily serine protease
MNKKILTIVSVALGALVALIINLKSNTVSPTTNQQLARTSVMITNGHGGGTGVIYRSGRNGSQILTNNHVCKAIKGGGLLTTTKGQFPIVSFQTSDLHDICLITTKANLGLSVNIAQNPPNVGDEAIASGHPNLLPHIVTRGHFTDHLRVPVMTGVRECTKEELESDLSMICVFLGGIPVIRVYESQVITSTIMAGSSGSAVFNSNGEISGLVFAGAGELSYGFIVPQEYVLNFVENELPKLELQYPNMELDVREMMKSEQVQRRKIDKLINRCNFGSLPEKVLELCNQLNKSIIR